MGRIFGIIAAISALMIMLVGGGTYWFSAADTKGTKQEAIKSIVSNLATNLSLQIDTLQKSVDGVALSPDVISALSTGNPALIKTTAEKFQTVVPHNLRLRLLLPNVNDLDESAVPRMGYGDLEMVRATLTDKPKPVIQGEAADRHLAITSPVLNGQQVVGVVLASINPDLPKQIVAKTQLTNGYIELKQDQLMLLSLGDTALKTDEPTALPVANSRWQIDSWMQVDASLSDISILIVIILIPALLACLAFFRGYRTLNGFLREDQSSILKAAKDMLQGKHVGNYPMQLEEMQPIITAMAQFKRVISQGGLPSDDPGQQSSQDDFFEESFELDFLEDTTPASAPVIESVPINIAALTSTQKPDLPNEDQDWRELAPAATSQTPDSWDMDLGHTDTAIATPAPTQAAQPSAAFMQHVFREFDISGIAEQELNQDLIKQIGQAFASEAKQLNVRTLVVGRDGRHSSPSLADALIQGIIATGCDVLDIGVVPTPVLCFVSHHSEGRTGIMVTGGDLSAEYNGLKMVLHGEPITQELMQRLKTRIDHHDFSLDIAGSVERNSVFSNEYIGIISEDIHIVRPMTVVIDCANGAAGQIAPSLLKTIGCDVVELYCDIDGQFPNHAADPGNPRNLEALIKAVKLNNADVGIALDGDGDRLGLVDSNGDIIWPDRQLMLFARDVLASKPGTEIIFDAGCSKQVPEHIKKRGGYPVSWKSGRTPLQLRLRETGAAFAGDIKGHFLFNDRWFGFSDGLYATIRMIEILSADMRGSHEVFADLPYGIATPEWQVPLPAGESMRFVEQLFNQAQFTNADIDKTDGLRADFPDGWGLVRASKTLPALELRFEADSSESLQRIQAAFKALLLQIKPDLSLPF